jgi:hypothetical protein
MPKLAQLKSNILKIGSILVQYLLRNKHLSLHGLGVFSIDSSANPVYDEEKQQYDSPIHFSPDSKAADDSGLIDFIVENSTKIRPLAIADLDSYLAAGKQLLNISKPFVIEGLGTLNRNTQGHVDFVAGTGASHITEEGSRHSKQKTADGNDAISFQDNYLRPPRSADNMTQKFLIAAAVLVGIAIIAWVVYFFLYREESRPLEQPPIVITKPVETPPDTTKVQAAVTDSIKPKQDSTVATQTAVTGPAPTSSGNLTYNIVIEYANKARALKRYAALQEWDSHVKLATKDSVYFKLYCTFTGPLSDTTHKKDSLSSYYGRKVYVELNP